MYELTSTFILVLLFMVFLLTQIPVRFPLYEDCFFLSFSLISIFIHVLLLVISRKEFSRCIECHYP